MWRINCSKLTLQEVLIMAYMNVLEESRRSSREAGRTPTGPGFPAVGDPRTQAKDHSDSRTIA